MPTDAADLHTTLFKNGTAAFLARVVGPDGLPLAIADISEAAYSVFQLDERDPDRRTGVDGHVDVPLDPAECLFDELQTDPIWTRDALGYNFRHVIDVSEKPAFPKAGRNYLVEYRLESASDPTVLVRFRAYAI